MNIKVAALTVSEKSSNTRCYVPCSTPCDKTAHTQIEYIEPGSYMYAQVLLNLLNEMGKRYKMRGLPSILSLFRNE